MRIYRVILAILVLAIACDDQAPPKATDALGSRIELAAGDVWIQDGDAQKRLITGAMLPEQARLTVGKGGRAMVRLGSGTAVFLRGDTAVSIDNESLRLVSGELWADIPAGERQMGRFTAGEVTVTASGAGFNLLMGGKQVVVYVARGIAVVNTPGGRKEIQTGERAEVKGQSAPMVEPVAFWEDWTGGMADRELLAGMGGRATGRLYGIDRIHPGSKPKELEINHQIVSAVIRDGVAQTTVDQRFFNQTDQVLEGYYWFTIPEGASVERFALEVNGSLIEGEMVERKQAREVYEEAVRRAIDPALLEWVDGRTYRARIYPIPPTGDRRVVLTYSELLPLADGAYRYIYPMGGRREVPIGEFSLQVDLGEQGQDMAIATLQDARIDAERKTVSMRRSGFVPRADFLLELRPEEKTSPMRVLRYSDNENEADYVMLRYAPEADWGAMKEVPGDVVVVLDTSAGIADSERQIGAEAVEAILRALSAGDRFAVVAADLSPRVVYPAKGLANADEQHVSRAVEKLAEVSSAGATDLGGIFSKALDLLHGAEQPAVVYVGDGRATVGESSTDKLVARLRRALGGSRARLFTIAVGADANYALLRRLAEVGGGRTFRIDLPEQTVQEALRFVGMVKTPTITELTVDAGNGLDQIFSTATGKVTEGQEVIISARTHHALPNEITVTGRLGGKAFETRYATEEETGSRFRYIPTLWARQYLDRLMGAGIEENRGRIISLGLNYALMTPLSSFLVLDSEAAYAEQGIPRRGRRFFGLDEADQQAAEAVEQEEVEWLQKKADDERQGGRGKRHKGDEGQMGKRDTPRTDSHYGIRGPKDSPNPQMAREAMKSMAGSAGISSSMGAKKGNQVGENFGYGGLGLAGTGRGGGGTGEETIGLGSLGTIGHGGGSGTGSGYGRGAGGLSGRRTKAPQIRSGSAIVKGSLSKDIVRRIVHRHINEVKFCYERQLAKRPDLSGRVSIKFIISGTGAVQMSAVAVSTIGDPQVENCIAQAVRRWTFPQPEGGGIVIVTYPFMLTAPEGGSAIASRQEDQPPSVPKEPPAPSSICSDTSSRPLAERRILWKRRLAQVTETGGYARIYHGADRACELTRWRDRRVLLNLIEGYARDPESVRTILASFGNQKKIQAYLSKRILRRALNQDVIMGLYGVGVVDWQKVVTGLAALAKPDDRVQTLRKVLVGQPADPVGRGLLVMSLFEADRSQEAMAEAMRLRRDRLASPMVLEILCDLQASADQVEEARRTCSELVEFNAEDPETRQRLGDLFLRHGWYAAAYRQYQSLVEMRKRDPQSLLRLATAAAGMGKVDEALRIERKVAEGEGDPGPQDPRRIARMHSAARLANLLMAYKEKKHSDKVSALESSLKRTQLFGTGSTLVLLVFEDFQSGLDLALPKDAVSARIAEKIQAGSTGLIALDLGRGAAEELALKVYATNESLKRQVPYQLITISWDGKAFTVTQKQGRV